MSMYKAVTLKEVRESLAIVDITISKRDDEYRVNYAGGAEATAYYTNDLYDAHDTGVLMAHTRRA